MRGGKSAQAESVALVTKRCRGVLLASTALAAVAAFLAPTLGMAADLDLAGHNTTLPAAPFPDPFLSGANNVTNSGVNATLSEGGGPAAPTPFTGLISNGVGSVSLTHTSGMTIINSANTFTGGTTIEAGTIQIGNIGALGTGAVTFANPGPGTLLSSVSGTLIN